MLSNNKSMAVEIRVERQPRTRLNSVLLIQPENGYYTGFQGLVRTEPLGLEFVAGAITSLVKDVEIQDERIKPGGWREKALKNPPDMIGVNCNYTADVPAARNLIKQIRHEVGKEIPIIVGGHHISLRPSDLQIPEVDAIVIGEGEKTFQRVVEAWSKTHSLKDVPDIVYKDNDGRFQSNIGKKTSNVTFTYDSQHMNERAEPRKDLVKEFRDGYYFLYNTSPISLETARGCRYRCTFCSVHNFHKGNFDVESATRTLEGIISFSKEGKSRYVNIVDDLAFSDIDAAEQIARGLIAMQPQINHRYWAQIRADNVWPKNPEKRARHLKVFELLAKAGLDMVLVGLESFDPAELKRVNKGSTVEQNMEAIKALRGFGIKIWGAQIVFPGWDVSDYDKTIAVNQALGIECPQFTILTPLPGTKDYEQAKKDGKLTSENPADFDFFHWVIPTKLPVGRTYQEMARMYKETSPYAKRADGKLASVREAIKYTRSIKDDIAAGRTSPQAVREFTARFEVLQDADRHIAHLANSGLAVSGSEEKVIFKSISDEKLTLA